MFFSGVLGEMCYKRPAFQVGSGKCLPNSADDLRTPSTYEQLMRNRLVTNLKNFAACRRKQLWSTCKSPSNGLVFASLIDSLALPLPFFKLEWAPWLNDLSYQKLKVNLDEVGT